MEINIENSKNILTVIANQACDLLNAEISSVFLKQGDKLVLSGISTKGKEHGLSDYSVYYKIGEGLTGNIATGNPIRLSGEDIHLSPHWKGKYDYINFPEKTRSTISFIGVPIYLNNKVVGVIKAESSKRKSGFTESEQKILETIAELISTAIRSQPSLISNELSLYVFVLMPFADKFKDIYELGIKEAALSQGMRVERVDEIEFNDQILKQIYSGIQRADIIVADMTGRNANVFYEVGYSHALLKKVILLTQDSDDIPFDLKGHNHIVYNGSITTLKKQLSKRLSVMKENILKDFTNI